MDRAEAIKREDRVVYNLLNHDDKEAARLAFEALREQESLAQATSEWVSVEERLPSNEDVVLCVTKNNRPFVCRYDHYWKRWRVSGSVKVTHWMNLPEPPKEGAEE